MKAQPSYNQLFTGPYSFQNMEHDDEVKGDGNSYNFGARILDPRLGRWLTIDPLSMKYPELSPFQFVSNMPIFARDPDGRQIVPANIYTKELFLEAVAMKYGSDFAIAVEPFLTNANSGNTTLKYGSAYMKSKSTYLDNLSSEGIENKNNSNLKDSYLGYIKSLKKEIKSQQNKTLKKEMKALKKQLMNESSNTFLEINSTNIEHNGSDVDPTKLVGNSEQINRQAGEKIAELPVMKNEDFEDNVSVNKVVNGVSIKINLNKEESSIQSTGQFPTIQPNSGRSDTQNTTQDVHVKVIGVKLTKEASEYILKTNQQHGK